MEIVENASFSFTDVFDHKAHGMLAYFHRSSVFVWTGENDSNTLRAAAYFSENGEHVFKMSIFKKIRIGVDEALVGDSVRWPTVICSSV